MAQWAVVIPADQWATERLFEHDSLIVAGLATADQPRQGSVSAEPSTASQERGAASAVQGGARAVQGAASAVQGGASAGQGGASAGQGGASAGQSSTFSAQGSASSGPAGTGPGGPWPTVDDEILLVAGPFVVGLGRVAKEGCGELVIAYTRRAFDEPVAADGLELTGAVTELASSVFRHFAGRLGGVRDRQTWLVSVDLPIEAATPAEAVRQFWSYVLELGPAELPAFVYPSGNELAMQAYVLGAEANQDPEEDED